MPIYTTTTSVDVEKNIPLTVSKLNQLSRQLLESRFRQIQVEGELSNLARPSSGHLYFSLKDSSAQIRCAFFRSRSSRLDFVPADGMQVVATASVSLYEPRGDYQLIVEQLAEAGSGRLQRAFLALKEKLSQQGLFEQQHKLPLPRFPRCIGLITSASGAAVKDMLITLQRRAPFIPVILYPTEVQGARAATSIVRAIDTANLRQECDVLLLARGGGSLEDLWSFNEEIVARAIFNSQLPIISGIGHETDTTISDYVADKRAATPTAAAEYASPNQHELHSHLKQLRQRLLTVITSQLSSYQLKLRHLKQRQSTPALIIAQCAQRLDRLELTLTHAIAVILQQKKNQLNEVQHLLSKFHPYAQMKAKQLQLNHFVQRLEQAFNHQLTNQRQRFIQLTTTLQAVSPLATLERGYAIALDEQRHIINSQTIPAIGAKIHVRLREKVLNCELTGVENANS